MITDVNIKLSPRDASDSDAIADALVKALKVTRNDISDWRVVRRSIDARQRRVMINLSVRVALLPDESVPCEQLPITYSDVSQSPRRVIIVGAGPAGLFAALRSIELGIRPIVIERGADVDTRRKDLAQLSRSGQVNPESNYCFGEGGAGAYSDGKLYTRSKKRGNVRHVLQVLHHHGASPDILVDAHPHIGSDRLPEVIKSMRNTILQHGGEVRFNTRMDDLLIEGDTVTGVKLSDGSELHGPVILATGHSARDVYRMLDRYPGMIEPKGLAIGVRLEHPQHLIDKIQYHSKEGRGKYLPAAEYSFVEQVDGRGVYSFCMCPGGVIVPAASAPGQLVVNGMSASARAGRWANSGIVVEVHPEDFPEYASHGNLCLMELQEHLEREFYAASGNTLQAPAQRMTDFVAGKISATLPPTSYVPGVRSLPLHFLLPPQISKRLAAGLRKMGAKSRGFLTLEAMLVGLESRTSSPVRIPRDSATLEHLNVKGLYPAGEGAGYAGGIVSAAIDGERCAEALAAVCS